MTMRAICREFRAVAGPLIVLALVAGCDYSPPLSVPRAVSENYLWCAERLDIFFLFRTDMPQDLYGFDSAEDLYRSVNEPWTVYFPPRQAGAFMTQLTTQRGGVGVLLDSAAAGYVIKDVFPRSPGEKAGLLRRDTIVAVDAVSCSGLRRTAVSSLLGGSAGTTRVLEVKRGVDTLTVPVVLGEYLAPSVHVDTLDSAVAYILLRMFADCTHVDGGTAAEFRAALRETQWAEGTILDLRGNPGGGVSQCLKVAGEFVPAGTPVVNVSERRLDSVVSRNSTRYVGTTVDTTWSTGEAGIAGRRTFAVLIDRQTASAAEIVAVALRDYRHDITLVGDTTFGKGRAQLVFYPSPGEGLAKITVARLQSVTGKSYDLVGIPPDRQIGPGEDGLETAWDILAPDTVLARQRRRTATAHYLTRVRRFLADDSRQPAAIMNIYTHGNRLPLSGDSP